MALQATLTLDNGSTASYWRVSSIRSEFLTATGTAPDLFVDVKGYCDASYRASNQALTSKTWQLTSGAFNDSGGSGVAPGWPGVLTNGSTASGDPRPALYDWLKSDTGGVLQNGHLFSGAADV
jgi:hypothetical protein